MDYVGWCEFFDSRQFYYKDINPTRYTLSENNKKKIAELSYKYNIRVIEDDYLKLVK